VRDLAYKIKTEPPNHMSFVPYQVDYSVQNAAKTLGFSKKRVTFKFGFANGTAIGQGLTGPQCRGSEHEIVFIWSLASGKRQLLCDNKDVHFSESGQNGWTNDRAWQHIFTLRDSHTNQSYRIHFMSQPQVKEVQNSYPFDLKIGGMSYFQFNQIYRLGTPQMIVGQIQSSPNAYHPSGRESPLSAEERQQLAAAKLASLQDIAERKQREQERVATVAAAAAEAVQSASNTIQAEDTLLISFDDDNGSIPPLPNQSSAHSVTSIGGTGSGLLSGGNPTTSNNYYNASSITLDPLIHDSSQDFNRQQPGSFYGNNPYATSQPLAPGGYSTSTSNYATNPYAGTTPSNASNALTPYQPNYGQPSAQQLPPQPYVDATGRLSMGQPPPASTYASNPYDYTTIQGNPNSISGISGGSGGIAASAYNLSSPSSMSYGSAPSFAQPPKPPPPIPPEMPSSSYNTTLSSTYTQNPYYTTQQTSPYGTASSTTSPPSSLYTPAPPQPYGQPPPVPTSSNYTASNYYPAPTTTGYPPTQSYTNY
jgi:hypothetical protein